MSIIQEPHIRCKGQTLPDEYQNTLRKHAPALAALLDSLDAGKTPDWLEVWAGLSEMVAFLTDCDENDYISAQIECLLPDRACSTC